MANWLVLGLGNPLSGADAFGPAVVARLSSGSPMPGVDIGDAGTDLLDWIARFADYDHLVLVDAIALDDRGHAPMPRYVETVAEQTFAAWDARSPGAHEMSPLAAVRLVRALQRGAGGTADAPSIRLVGLFVSETDFARHAGDSEIAAGAEAVQRLVASPANPAA